MIVLSLIVSIYYNVIMAYSLIYIGASVVGTYDELPWTYCGKDRLYFRRLINYYCLSLLLLLWYASFQLYIFGR